VPKTQAANASGLWMPEPLMSPVDSPSFQAVWSDVHPRPTGIKAARNYHYGNTPFSGRPYASLNHALQRDRRRHSLLGKAFQRRLQIISSGKSSWTGRAGPLKPIRSKPPCIGGLWRIGINGNRL